jgi:LacI family transcriptional regulator
VSDSFAANINQVLSGKHLHRFIIYTDEVHRKTRQASINQYMGAMNYALDHGVRIPQDLAVVGCGNLHYDDSLRVPLSSIDQHSRRIGEEAARIALRILNSKAPPKPETVVMQPELIVRESTHRRTGKDISKKVHASVKRSQRP